MEKRLPPKASKYAFTQHFVIIILCINIETGTNKYKYININN